ncbi:MAG TPA: NAD(P)-dependent oxidoreductase [Planctomycetaceae bacterium]|jgi:dTDP-4-dehydrorhamnose reductase|nr:NAD(P)-dependent oxidoreductase [Planctomycetaceae bacterium]
MRKCAITGGGGFVAGSVIHQAPADWELHALSGKAPLTHRTGLVWHTLDLKEPEAVKQTLAKIAPDVVIHAAAMANIDFCEQHPDQARTINVVLTQAVADSCSQSGARFIYVSTDNVFDGERGGYAEHDQPTPINEYARTKAAGEGIAAAVAGSVTARIALVMGFGPLGGGNSFLERTIPMLRSGETINVPPEEIRTPIDVLTLGRALLELAAGSFQGTLHLAGNDVLDRVTLTRRIAERFGYSPGLVRPKSPEQIPGRAPRPRDVSMSNALARSTLTTPMLDFDAALDLVLTSLD